MKNTMRRILEKARSIPDGVLFTSKEFRNYIAYLLSGMCDRFNQPPVIVLYEGDPEETACTNSKEIRININCDLICETEGRLSTRTEKTRAIKAMAAHEGGHIIYTSFKLSSKVTKKFLGERTLWPLCDYADKVEHAEELLSYLSGSKGDFIFHIYKHLENTLEDAYVDDQITGGRYPVGRDRLWLLKKFKEKLPTFGELIEKEKNSKEPEKDALDMALQLFFAYAKLHVILPHEKKEEKHEAMQFLFSHASEIDAVLKDDEPLFRTARSQKLLCLYWPYIKAYIDSLPEDEEPSETMGQSAIPEPQAPEGDGGTGMTGNDESGKKPNKSQKNGLKKLFSSEGGDNDSDHGSEGQSENVSCGEGNGGCGNAGDKDDVDEPGDSDAGELERILKSIASDEVDNEEAREGADEFKAIQRNMKNPSMQGLRIRADVPWVTDDSEVRYADIKDMVEKTSKAIIRFFRQQIQAKDGYKMSGFYSGNKLSMQAMASNSMAFFEKKKLPGETPKLSVAYLGDESGSMGGNKQFMNMLTAECVYAFCSALDVPVGVYGHSTGYLADVHLNVYSDFRRSPKDKFKIAEITSGGCNRDGAAIRLVGEKLLKQASDYHVMIITSDGLPSAYDSDEEGIQDIQDAVREYSRRGVHFVAAAMDEDKETIRNIYGNAFLDISDLEKMPKKLVQKLADFLV